MRKNPKDLKSLPALIQPERSTPAVERTFSLEQTSTAVRDAREVHARDWLVEVARRD